MERFILWRLHCFQSYPRTRADWGKFGNVIRPGPLAFLRQSERPPTTIGEQRYSNRGVAKRIAGEGGQPALCSKARSGWRVLGRLIYVAGEGRG
jgi:hypothetical protein